jgi:hypothetical protein
LHGNGIHQPRNQNRKGVEGMKRCGKHGRKAWIEFDICALQKPEMVCEQCDVEINAIVLRWRYPKTWQRRLRKYKAQKWQTE